MEVKKCLVDLLPFAAMVMIEIADVGLTTISKSAMSRGMSRFVFVVYSNTLGAIILLPYSLIISRNKRPPLNLSVLCKFFILSFVGITLMQNCIFAGVNYSSPTLASALSNLVPALTFLLAVIFRMEKLNLRSFRSQIKVFGTFVCIVGALVVTLYKGPSIGANPKQPPQPPSSLTLLDTTDNWALGGLFIAIGGLSLAIFFVSQAAVLKGYPSEITMVSFYSLFGAIQSAVVAFIAENNPNAWKLNPDIELVAIAYSAIFGNVVTFSVVAWVIRTKGPVFVAMFKPLGISIAAFLGVIFLGDTLHVGSIIGAVIIVVGFYGVVWAQSKEEEEIKHHKDGPYPSSDKAPLLESHVKV